MGLYDMILIKENHIEAAGSIKNAVDRCKKYSLDKNLNCKIEVETTNLDQVREALASKVDQIMLDNMSLKEMRDAVALVNGAAILEASGGVTLENIRSIAEVGVNLISVGALTHSAPVLDFSLLLQDI
jgi:nicotinate-nucleotide pyrophosphorylase (carboxylating)